MATRKQNIKRPWVKTYKPFERNVDNSSFYNSRQWRKVRANYIEKNPLCEICEDNGLVVPGKVVDHIKRIVDGGDKFNEDNLMTLCEKCHNSKSGKESRGIWG